VGQITIMVSLTLKRAKFSRLSGQWQDEDYDVLADGRVVGRILEWGSRFDPPDLRCTWSITSIWPARLGMTKAPPRRAKRRWRRGTNLAPHSRSSDGDHTTPEVCVPRVSARWRNGSPHYTGRETENA